MKERSQREMSHLPETRELLVKQRSALKTKINQLLLVEGIKMERKSWPRGKALERALTLPLWPLMLAGSKNLMRIKGLAALLFIVVGYIRDFPRTAKLATRPGLAPGIHNSNEVEHSDRITKKDNNLARTRLVQCPLIAKRYSSLLKSFYRRIQRWRGDRKTNTAQAAKLQGHHPCPQESLGFRGFS